MIWLFNFFKTRWSKDKALYEKLYNVLGFYPNAISLYKIAITHNSYRHLSAKGKSNNERLEFLGDAVLGMVIAEKLYLKFPYQNEGFLTETRSKIVGRNKLNQIAKKMGIHQLLFYDQKLKNNPAFLEGVAGNAFESLIGAIYLDKGFNFTRKFILNTILVQHIDFETLLQEELSYKAKLIKWAQKEKRTLEMVLLNVDDSQKRKVYEMAVVLEGEQIASVSNISKKTAEEMACVKACQHLGL